MAGRQHHRRGPDPGRGAGRLRVGDKTGTGGYGTDNDIGVLWPPAGRAPIVLAVLSTRPTADLPPSNALVAQAARIVLAAL